MTEGNQSIWLILLLSSLWKDRIEMTEGRGVQGGRKLWNRLFGTDESTMFLNCYLYYVYQRGSDSSYLYDRMSSRLFVVVDKQYLCDPRTSHHFWWSFSNKGKDLYCFLAPMTYRPSRAPCSLEFCISRSNEQATFSTTSILNADWTLRRLKIRWTLLRAGSNPGALQF